MRSFIDSARRGSGFVASALSERGIALVHTTILRWVQRYVPEFEKLWKRYARPVGGSWRCDETYLKVKGRWTYLYRAVELSVRIKKKLAPGRHTLQLVNEGAGVHTTRAVEIRAGETLRLSLTL